MPSRMIYYISFYLRQNVLIFFKILNHRWRSLTWFHRCFWAQTNFFVKFIYKTPRKHLQNPWHSYHNFWQPKSRYRHKPDHLPPEYWLDAFWPNESDGTKFGQCCFFNQGQFLEELKYLGKMAILSFKTPPHASKGNIMPPNVLGIVYILWCESTT